LFPYHKVGIISATLVVIRFFLRKCVCFCISAGEQWTQGAAWNQSGGVSGFEERRAIGEHVAVATADQRRR